MDIQLATCVKIAKVACNMQSVKVSVEYGNSTYRLIVSMETRPTVNSKRRVWKLDLQGKRSGKIDRNSHRSGILPELQSPSGAIGV